MNKIYLTGLAMMLATSALTATAKPVDVYPLGDRNTMVKIIEPQRYLILPVQEAMPDSRVEIMVDGNIVQTIYVRLADTQVDYTVPLDLTPFTDKGNVTLNIVSEVQHTNSKNAANFICWDNLQLSDNYDTTNREKYRPAYHHTPLYGWMNDPNGMFYKDGVWHLYYQHNPYGSKWQNMSWGHSTSNDLIHWEHQPEALIPNGMGAVFSGSSVVDKNNTAGFGEDAIVALYTSCAYSQVQSLAYSNDDGQTFTFYSGNPVIPNPTEARDPNMFWHEPTQQWVLVLAHALDHEMQIYTSPNLKDWTLQSAFGNGYGAQEGVWECPDLFQLPVKGTKQNKWVLLCNINPGGPFGGSGTQYFIGEFDGKTFTPDNGPEVTKWMDFGKDHYATVTWSDAPDNRRTAIGWMSNWQYANEVPTMQYRSANTLPLELGLFKAPDGQIYLSSTPSPEVEKLRGEMKSLGKQTITSTATTYDIPQLAEIVLNYDAAKCKDFTITLSNENGDEVVMTLDPKARTFSVDRTNSGIKDFSQDFPAKTTAPTFDNKGKGTLRIFIDNSSIEVFDGEGKFAMTNLVFPTAPYNKMTLQSQDGNVKLNNLEIYSISL